jgi:hypothetical protein
MPNVVVKTSQQGFTALSNYINQNAVPGNYQSQFINDVYSMARTIAINASHHVGFAPGQNQNGNGQINRPNNPNNPYQVTLNMRIDTWQGQGLNANGTVTILNVQ